MLKEIEIKLVSEFAKVPTRAHDDDSGLDLYSCEEKIIYPAKFIESGFQMPIWDDDSGMIIGWDNNQLVPDHHEQIDTGVQINLPYGFEAQIRPKSGMSLNGIMVLFGTIDSSYQGSLKVVLYNFNNAPFRVDVGQKIAQLVIVPVHYPTPKVVDHFSPKVFVSTRGDAGFGSTGLF